MSKTWLQLAPALAKRLSDCRLQIHHAAQLATAIGISYLPKQPDDSHTNLEWLSENGVLSSHPVDGFRAGMRVADFSLMAGSGVLGLRGRTIAHAEAFIREQLESSGLDPARFTLERHYEIPFHPVATGQPFDANDAHLRELSAWLANGATELEAIRASDSRASEVRCWPHHFDVATLIVVRKDASVGVGLELGDEFYDEPYFYVNARPAPHPESLPPTLAGGGSWHTHRWIGAVLPGSRLSGNSELQSTHVAEFLDSAVAACLELVT